MRCAATQKQFLQSRVNLGVAQPFLCWPTTWSGSGTAELHRHERHRPKPVLLMRGSSAMSLRGPMRTADSTDCLVEAEVASERGGGPACSAHACRKPSNYSNPRFVIHPLRPRIGCPPLDGGSSQIRPQLKFAAKLNAALGHLLSCASCISWFTAFLGWLQIVCNLAPVLL
jgi:hypothetical protein